MWSHLTVPVHVSESYSRHHWQHTLVKGVIILRYGGRKNMVEFPKRCSVQVNVVRLNVIVKNDFRFVQVHPEADSPRGAVEIGSVFFL